MLQEAAEECRKLCESDRVLCVRGDCASVEDMAKVRDAVIKEWNGIDTLIITAGVSALQPLMTVAGVTASKDGLSLPHATAEATNHAVSVAKTAINGNFLGPYIVDTSPHDLFRVTVYSSPFKCGSNHSCANANPLRFH